MLRTQPFLHHSHPKNGGLLAWEMCGAASGPDVVQDLPDISTMGDERNREYFTPHFKYSGQNTSQVRAVSTNFVAIGNSVRIQLRFSPNDQTAKL